MGSWNETCLISNLPIYAGDEVVFFTLKRKSDDRYATEGGHCYVDDIYEPLLYPVVGKYNDYGSIEDVQEDFSLLEEYFEDVELTQNYWDEGGDIFYQIERANYKGHTYALAHKDIYDALIEKTNDRGEWWTKGKSLREHVIENLDKRVDEYNKQKRIWAKIGEEVVDVAPSFFGVHDVICGRSNRDFFIARYLKTKNEVLRNKLIEMHLINVVLSQCRKFWFPPCGKGSQSSETDLYEIIANKIIEKVQQKRKDWEE